MFVCLLYGFCKTGLLLPKAKMGACTLVQAPIGC